VRRGGVRGLARQGGVLRDAAALGRGREVGVALLFGDDNGGGGELKKAEDVEDEVVDVEVMVKRAGVRRGDHERPDREGEEENPGAHKEDELHAGVDGDPKPDDLWAVNQLVRVFGELRVEDLQYLSPHKEVKSGDGAKAKSQPSEASSNLQERRKTKAGE